jgi:sarcosine/dimethylglycine N-methyltransferase
MEKPNITLLPGLNRQVKFLLERLYKQNISNTLIIGSASENQAKKIIEKFGCKVELIVEDYESLINSKYIIRDSADINIKMMSYESTDFKTAQFDLIYAQASISLTDRNKIIKEINRILKPGGFFCAGEIVSLQKEIPRFVQDVYDSSDLLPLFVNDLDKYYTDRKFSIIEKLDLSHTLKDYYTNSLSLFDETIDKLNEKEKSYYKKIINRIKHESNLYLNHGGDKFIGYAVLLLRKGEN